MSSILPFLIYFLDYLWLPIASPATNICSLLQFICLLNYISSFSRAYYLPQSTLPDILPFYHQPAYLSPCHIYLACYLIISKSPSAVYLSPTCPTHKQITLNSWKLSTCNLRSKRYLMQFIGPINCLLDLVLLLVTPPLSPGATRYMDYLSPASVSHPSPPAYYFSVSIIIAIYHRYLYFSILPLLFYLLSFLSFPLIATWTAISYTCL